MMTPWKEYCFCLLDKKLMPTALKVSLTVGSMLFMINHGSALIEGEMNRQRWISAMLTYFVPYGVNIHGQWISRRQQKSS